MRPRQSKYGSMMSRAIDLLCLAFAEDVEVAHC